ncbi:MAG: LamG domain-containing protein [Kofleriaceae bacterium]
MWRSRRQSSTTWFASRTSTVVSAIALAACGRGDFDLHQDGSIDSPTIDTIDAPAFPLPQGLIARYPMDDVPATSGVAIPPSFTATCDQCPSTVPGVIGNAWHFTQTQYLVVPDASVVDPSHAYSVAVWLNADAGIVGNPALAQELDDTEQSDTFALNFVDSDGALSFETTSGGSAIEYVQAPGELRGAWHHVVATWDGTTKTMYIDGVNVGSKPATIAPSAQPLEIGRDRDLGAPKFLFAGDLDELEFYDHALSDTDVAMVFSAR